jgi:PmbA protein
MKNEMMELAGWVMESAKSAGADDCRVSLSEQRSIQISYRDRKPENIKEASQKGLSLEIFADGRYSRQNTQDLRRTELQSFISNAVSTTGLLAVDPYRTLPDPKYYRGRQDVDLELVDADYAGFSPGDRHKMVQNIEDACLTQGGDRVISVVAGESDSHLNLLVLTSNGFEGTKEATGYDAYALITLRDEKDRRPMEYDGCSCRARKDLPAPETIGKNTALRGFSRLGEKKIRTEKMPVIVENRNVSDLLGGFLDGMYGSAIQQKQSFLADRKGKRIGSRLFTLIDDPFIKGGLGSNLFDADGIAARRRTMVDAGMLDDFYVNWYYSRKLGWEPTTAEPTNLVIPAGRRSVKEIMQDLGRGIIIRGFIGGNSNSTTGDFSIGINGRLFEKGEEVQAVAEMNIAGNHLEFWHRLAEAGNDTWIYSNQRTPSLVFEDVMVSGI